jgi:hypothetical protein
VPSTFAVYALALLSSAGLAQPPAYTVVDVQSVRAEGDPAEWVRTVRRPEKLVEYTCDILVAGAGMGGSAAALRAADRGHSVCLTEETDWIGGQATAGGVSALDENRFIELAGGTRRYQEFRHRIRQYYREHYTLSEMAARLEHFNPGSCYVSPLCFEPKVGLTVLDAMIALRGDRIRLLKRTQIVELEVNSGAIRSAVAYRFDQRNFVRIVARFVLDATELGDLLPLARVPYVVGAEPRSDTGEPHASESANAACVQSFTYPFALEYRPGEAHRVPKPPGYEGFRDSQRFTLRLNYPAALGWKGDVQYTMFGDVPPIPNNQTPGPFFSWRRMLARANFAGPDAPSDLALINWPRQDYARESILDQPPIQVAQILQRAKRVSLAFLYWLQNELSRDDGHGKGYPELMLRSNVMGTVDGLSKYPYIRESRRIRGQSRVVEQDIVAEFQQRSRARWFQDSVGTGFYMVDIHPCGAGEPARMMMPRPFQIPMGTLLPQGISNLLAAGKNISVTHVTNGAFRLHPVEWNVGEAAAVIASLAIAHGGLPKAVEVQTNLVRAGVPVVWFDDLPVTHPAFADIQLAAIRGLYPLAPDDLHASPEAPLTRGQAAQALATLFESSPTQTENPILDVPATHPQAAAIRLAVAQGWMATDHRNWFHADLPFYWIDWREGRFPRGISMMQTVRSGPVLRAEFARRLTRDALP